MRNRYLVLLCLVACTCSGCFGTPSLKDPFGTYAARITMNDRNAEAQETIARYDRDARIAEAEQMTEAKVNTAKAWTGMVPNVVLLLVVGTIVVVYIQWHGRITLARLAWGERPGESAPITQWSFDNLQAMAAQRNQHFTIVNGVALLIDKDTGEVVKQRRLKG